MMKTREDKMFLLANIVILIFPVTLMSVASVKAERTVMALSHSACVRTTKETEVK